MSSRHPSGNAVTILATYTFEKPVSDADIADLGRLASATRSEPGNLAYRITRDLEDERVILIYERYRDIGAVAAHRESEHFTTLVLEVLSPRLSSRVPTLLTDLLV
ncbi:hypothetical protein GCM10009775_24110 [Microbacterium aoyamense]|uniref:ABM domain-containing protein n=2 Tax=Microbacterium aoyamense TaxID=344166 RepID=A0ABN2PTM9_9MICO|nr:putative quinol monooxygenase [Microbacterium aoyamense]